MTYRLLLFSQEEEHFVMEIMAPPYATFRELHDLILRSCSYTELDNHFFLVCDENWKTREKIHLHDTGSTAMDEDLYLMDSTVLEDFLEEEGQHLAYIYEPSERKAFIIELVENIFGNRQETLRVSRCKGTPPAQTSAPSDDTAGTATADSTATPSAAAPASGEDDYAADNATDDTFSEDELDMEGFEVSDM